MLTDIKQCIIISTNNIIQLAQKQPLNIVQNNNKKIVDNKTFLCYYKSVKGKQHKQNKKEVLKMKALANEIFNTLYDLDFQDYTETTEKDLKALEKDLQLLEKKR